MKISGHKTRSTLDRYNIASVEDTRDAVVRTAAYVANLSMRRKIVGIESFRKHGQNTDIPAGASRQAVKPATLIGGSGWESNRESAICSS